MAKSELLKEILTDYCAQEDNKFQEAILQQFCDFAADWLAKRGIIGMGHTAEGLALRLSDGSERILFGTSFDTPTIAPYFQITGVPGKNEKLPNANYTYPITGQ